MVNDVNDEVALSSVPQAILRAWGVLPAATKGPKPRWDLTQILETAVRLGDEDGIEAITMSGLAKALGSGTMSLYRYVESREDLLILAADHALGPGRSLEGSAGKDRLRRWVWDLRRTYEEHPWLTSMPVGTEPLLPSYLRRLESGLACLDPIGVSGARAITVLTMLWTYTRGDVEQTTQLSAFAAGQPGEINRLAASRVRALSGSAGLPRVLAALENDVDPKTDDEEFDAAIDLIIAGLMRT